MDVRDKIATLVDILRALRSLAPQLARLKNATMAFFNGRPDLRRPLRRRKVVCGSPEQGSIGPRFTLRAGVSTSLGGRCRVRRATALPRDARRGDPLARFPLQRTPC